MSRMNHRDRRKRKKERKKGRREGNGTKGKREKKKGGRARERKINRMREDGIKERREIVACWAFKAGEISMQELNSIRPSASDILHLYTDRSIRLHREIRDR